MAGGQRWSLLFPHNLFLFLFLEMLFIKNQLSWSYPFCIFSFPLISSPIIITFCTLTHFLTLGLNSDWPSSSLIHLLNFKTQSMFWGKLLEVFLCFSSVSLTALSTFYCRCSFFSPLQVSLGLCSECFTSSSSLAGGSFRRAVIFVLSAPWESHLVARSNIKAGMLIPFHSRSISFFKNWGITGK